MSNNAIANIKKNAKGILFMGISSLCVCFGQLFWKLYHLHGIGYLILGFGLYGIGALVMIYAFRFGKVSVLQPVLSMNYILTIILANLVLNEHIGAFQYAGIFLVFTGVIFISGSE